MSSSVSPASSPADSDQSRKWPIRLSVDWASFLVAIVIATFIRFGIIGRIPW